MTANINETTDSSSDKDSEYFGWDNTIPKEYLEYDKQFTVPDKIYICSFEEPETGRYLIKCVLGFYNDGGTWKLKQYALYAK